VANIDRLVSLLRCPQNRGALHVADRDLVERLNARIGRRALEDQRGERVSRKLDGALVRDDGVVAYPVRGGLYDLLIDDAIPLDQLG
jgi:uncharacterized protein YbaR (Trm112 family)